MKNNKSPIVKLGMEVSSSFDSTTTVEEHSQDLRNFLDGMTEEQKCEKFKGRNGL